MATITLDVEKMMKKKGYGANGFGSSGGLLGSRPYGSLLMKKKTASEDDSDDDEEQHHQYRHCPHVIARAILEDLFGLKLKSEDEREKMKKNPPVKDNTSSTRGRRGGVSIKEDEEGKTVKMEMPGLGKEDVKVRVVNNTLLIEGKETDDDDKNENGMKDDKNKWGLYLPDDEYKCDELKAVMKNGVLTVVVPKKKVDEREDVIHVLVED